MMITNTTTALKQVHTELLKDSVATPQTTKPQCFIHIQRSPTILRNLKNTWKIIIVLSLVPLTTFFGKPDVALAGSFSETCEDINGFEREGRYYLEAICEEEDDDAAPTELAISEYIANYGGNLSWATPPGIFHRSCGNIHVDEDGILSADCGNGRGGWIGTELNLNERISNQDGVLDYDD